MKLASSVMKREHENNFYVEKLIKRFEYQENNTDSNMGTTITTIEIDENFMVGNSNTVLSKKTN